jgi:hypothetical protein
MDEGQRSSNVECNIPSLDPLQQCFSNCGPLLSAGDFGRKIIAKMFIRHITNDKYTRISVLKLPFFVDFQLKLGELILWIPFCASVIIWENTLNLFIEKLWLW